MRRSIKGFFVLAVTLIFISVVAMTAFSAPGAGYSISKFTVEGGVYNWQTGGGYSLAGAAGEHDAGYVTGGSYELGGGIWPGPVVFEQNFIYLPITIR